MEPRKAKSAIIVTAVSSLVIVAVCLVFIFSLGGSGSTKAKQSIFKTESTENTDDSDGKETHAEDSTDSEAEAYLEEANRLLDNGDYYEAFANLYQCYMLEPSDPVMAECDRLYKMISSALSGNEPKTGTELERTFQFQGGSDLIVTAKSGPAEMTVESTNDPSKYVRFYIRHGETATIYLPSQAEYHVAYKIGALWFNDEIGFGEYYSDGDWGTLECNYSSDGSWITNSVWRGSI